MQCKQCHFENMPGLARCFKCGSVLVASAEPLDINPPRMRPWKKPLRDINRMIRQTGLVRPITRPKWFETVAADSLLSISFSIIPGLGHYLYGSLRNVLWLVIIWVAAIFGSIFLYGSSFGMLLIGLAAGIHAFIAMSCYYFEQQKAFLRRIALMIILCIAAGTLYHLVGGWIFSDFTGQFSAMEFNNNKIKTGDFLLARSSLARASALTSGDLVLAWAGGVNNHRGFFLNNDVIVVGQVIGSGNDAVDIKNGTYFLNGKALDKSRFPVPPWLQKVNISVIIPPGSYFISSAYNVRGHGNFGPIENYIEQLCVIGKDRIVGKVFMRWLPLTRRGFIKGSS